MWRKKNNNKTQENVFAYFLRTKSYFKSKLLWNALKQHEIFLFFIHCHLNKARKVEFWFFSHHFYLNNFSLFRLSSSLLGTKHDGYWPSAGFRMVFDIIKAAGLCKLINPQVEYFFRSRGKKLCCLWQNKASYPFTQTSIGAKFQNKNNF